MKKRVAAILLALVFVCSLPVGEIVRAESTNVQDSTDTETETTQVNDDFLVKIHYGIDSLISYSGNTPVQVTVTNQGEDFTGEIALVVVRDGAKNFGYCNDISIPQGTTKNVFMSIPANTSFENCIVRILDEDENIVYERTVMNNISMDISDIAAVLTDDYAAVNYLDSMSVAAADDSYAFVFHIGQLTEETMPDIVSALGSCKIIVIDNYDTSKLSDAQYQALCQWVEQGGILLLGTGSEYNKVLSKFQDDFLTGTIGSLSKQAVAFADGVTLDIDTLDIQIDGGSYVSDAADGTLFIEKEVGTGKVIVCRAALGMEPFTSYEGNQDAIAELIQSVMTPAIIAAMDGTNTEGVNFDTSSYVVDGVGEVDMPDVGKYVVYFVIYILVVGPGIYLFLKWKNKNKALWVCIPLIAIAFTAGIYVISYHDTLKDPILNSYTIETYGEDTKTVFTEFSVMNPKSESYEINIQPSYTNIGPLQNTNYYSYSSELYASDEVAFLIKEKVDYTKIKLTKSQSFTPIYLSAVSTEATQQNIEMDMNEDLDGFYGTVTNHLEDALIDVLVCSPYYGYYIERIAPGETVELKKEDIMAINDIWTFISQCVDPVKNQDSYNRLSLTESTMASYYYSLGEGGFLAGYVEGASVDISSDSTVTENGLVLAVKDIVFDGSGIAESFTPNIHTEYMGYTDSDWDTTFGYTWDDSDIEVEYDFEISGINTLFDMGTSDGTNERSCYIWDPTAQSWVEMFASDTEFSLKGYYTDQDESTILLMFSGNGDVPRIAGGVK